MVGGDVGGMFRHAGLCVECINSRNGEGGKERCVHHDQALCLTYLCSETLP